MVSTPSLPVCPVPCGVPCSRSDASLLRKPVRRDTGHQGMCWRGQVWGHLPHQLLVVEGQWGLPAEDVHLALEDRHQNLPFYALL